jgi:hypothetical protein
MPTFTTLSNLRMTKREVAHFTAALKLTNVDLGISNGYYFIRQCDAETDPLAEVFAALRRELREQRKAARIANNARRGRVTGTTRPARSQGTGVCAAVRQWASEHPEANVQDAVQAFPNANKTTVRIQFKKAHG